MMTNLDKLGFTFKVGEIAYHRLVSLGYSSDKKTRTPVLIVERFAMECPGGVQLLYNCRIGVPGSGAVTFEPTRTYPFNEIELAKE
jgi:hypothetical protein